MSAHATFLLSADAAGAQYDQVIDIDLTTIEPHINGPFTAGFGDLAEQVCRERQGEQLLVCRAEGWADRIMHQLVRTRIWPGGGPHHWKSRRWHTAASRPRARPSSRSHPVRSRSAPPSRATGSSRQVLASASESARMSPRGSKKSIITSYNQPQLHRLE